MADAVILGPDGEAATPRAPREQKQLATFGPKELEEFNRWAREVLQDRDALKTAVAVDVLVVYRILLHQIKNPSKGRPGLNTLVRCAAGFLNLSKTLIAGINRAEALEAELLRGHEAPAGAIDVKASGGAEDGSERDRGPDRRGGDRHQRAKKRRPPEGA